MASVLYLCGCHCAPLYSVLHIPVPAAYLDCRPEARLDGNSLSEAFVRDGVSALDAW